MKDKYKLSEVITNQQLIARFERLMDPQGLVIGANVKPHWFADGRSFWFLGDSGDLNVGVHRVDGVTGTKEKLFDASDVRRVLVTQLGLDIDETELLLSFETLIDLAKGRYEITISEARHVIAIVDNRLEIESSTSGTPPDLPTHFLRPMWLNEPMCVPEVLSPDERWSASLQNGNILLRQRHGGDTVQLTNDGTPEFAWDIEANRPRLSVDGKIEQHLINPWSCDSKHLFAMKVDRRAVHNMSEELRGQSKQHIYSRKAHGAGSPIDIAYPHVLNIETGGTIRLDVDGLTDTYVTFVGWSPGKADVVFARYSRDFKRVDVFSGNSRTGAVSAIVSEQTDTFIAIQHEVLFQANNHICLLQDGSGLIWRSARSGWHHFYLYGNDGGCIRALTSGEFPVIDVVDVDTEEGWVYFTAHHDQARPYDVHLCRVKLDGGGIHRLTEFDGCNIASLSPSKTRLTVVNSRPDRPPQATFHRNDGSLIAVIERAKSPSIDEFRYIPPEEFSVLAADGRTTLWGVMHKPADFDPANQYPVINHIYGGPNVSIVPHYFSLGQHTRSRLDAALAQLGYVVVTLDARGTPGRSKPFQDVVYRNWGRYEIADHSAAIRQLAELHSYLDLSRVGVWGHSWGGYFAVRSMTQAPELFRVGVAVAPGSDVHDSILYEPYLDLPERNPEGYQYASNRDRVCSITGALMIIVGTADGYIYRNALRTVRELIDAQIDHEFVVLPEAGHFFEGSDDQYFVRKLVGHFEKFLKPKSGPS